MAKHRLGLLGPIIVIVGAIAAGVAAWYMVTARPKAGEVIDRIAIDRSGEIVIRREEGGSRSFIELHENGALKWQALIPPYAGAPGRRAVAWNDRAITVRVDRESGRAEVFAFSRSTSSKLGALRLAQAHEPIHIHAEGPITLTDHVRSYELVGGADWHELIAIDLNTGEGVWRTVLGKAPITAAGVEGEKIWVEQQGKKRWLDAATGREEVATQPVN